MIKTKRVYEPYQETDGKRFLVERLWPRGIRKDDLKMEAWMKEIAPSSELRKWYSHDPGKWEEFRKRYQAELAANRNELDPLIKASRHGDVTLLYAARDTERNSANVLKDYLEKITGMGK